MTDRRSFIGLLAGLPIAGSFPIPALAAPGAPRVERLHAASGRIVDVSIWNGTGTRAGTILFSHGFGSAPQHYSHWIAAWRAAGFDIAAPLHTDSRDHPLNTQLKGQDGWASRIEDVRAISRYLDRSYVAAGHSYGALTALTLGGVAADAPAQVAGDLADPLAVAVLAFSPPPPVPTLVSREAFAQLSRPVLVQTGSRDILPGTTEASESWRGHLTAFAQASPGGDRHALILDGVDHYFGGLICDPSRTGPDQKVQLQLATQASLLFLSAYGHARNIEKHGLPSFPTSHHSRFYRK